MMRSNSRLPDDDKVESRAATGSGGTALSPRATDRISSRRSRSDFVVIVQLLVSFSRFRVECEGHAFQAARAFNFVEEVADQFVGPDELVTHKVGDAPKPMTVVVRLPARYAVRIVEPQ